MTREEIEEEIEELTNMTDEEALLEYGLDDKETYIEDLKYNLEQFEEEQFDCTQQELDEERADLCHSQGLWY